MNQIKISVIIQRLNLKNEIHELINLIKNQDYLLNELLEIYLETTDNNAIIF